MPKELKPKTGKSAALLSGVYQMKDRLGQVIYVGKAKDLKKRVSTYFQASRKMAVAQLRCVPCSTRSTTEIIIVNEAEALLLRATDQKIQAPLQYRLYRRQALPPCSHDPRESLPASV